MEGKWKFLRALFYASGSNMPKGIDKHSVPMIGMTWFLVALFICQICYLCVKKVSEEYNISMWILVIALAILAAQLKEKVWLPLEFRQACMECLFTISDT